MNTKVSLLIAVLLISGCATVPTGPGAVAYPGTGKNFDQFRADDGSCRDYALNSIGGKSPQQAAENSAVATAAVGTAIGAVAGALIGGGRGAGIGAGTGLIAGSAVGANNAQAAGRG